MADGSSYLLLELASPTVADIPDFSPVHSASTPLGTASTTIDLPVFYATESLMAGTSYSSISTTPLPCAIPAGTTLYLHYGAFGQSVVTLADANPGDTSVPVGTTINDTSFISHHDYAAISYLNGEMTDSGLIITTGLSAELHVGQPIALTVGNVAAITNVLTYTPKDASQIQVDSLLINYPFSGNGTAISFTADVTLGDTSITSVSSTAGLSVGQAITSANADISTPYYIAAISGSTITLDRAATFSSTGEQFTVNATQLIAPFHVTMGSGGTVETVYPISLPVDNGDGTYLVSLTAGLQNDHSSGESFVYYQWLQNPRLGDVTYRDDTNAFYLWDGEQWRTARVDNVQGVYAALGSVGSRDFTTVTFKDPSTGQETPPDNFNNLSSKAHEVHIGGSRYQDPNKNEWTGDSIRNTRLHLKVRVPQSSKVAFRTIGLQTSYRSSPLAKNIHLSPSDNLEIDPANPAYVNWNFSDLEGDAQTGWEVKIFSDLTYNSSAFDPNTSPYAWRIAGHDASKSVNIPPNIGLKNGERYWLFIRVAKQFHQSRWFGDWSKKDFTVIVDQPLPPIVSIWSDGSQARNVLQIQSTDNLLGPSNGGFDAGSGGWTALSGSNYSTAQIQPVATGIALSQPLKHDKPVTSLSVGAVGYIAKGSSIPASGLGTFRVSGSRKKTTDPMGFPRGGKFWVTVGTNSGAEYILVQNMLDGNNTGDTFKIIQRNYSAYNGPTALGSKAHASGSQVQFGLQTAVRTGSIVDLDYRYTTLVHTTKTTTSMVRYYTGTFGSPGSSGVTQTSSSSLVIMGPSDVYPNDRTRIMVRDVNGVLDSSSIGKNVTVSFRHWDKMASTGIYKITKKKNGSQTLKPVLAGNAPNDINESNTIAGIHVRYPIEGPGVQRNIAVASVTSTVLGNKAHPITEIPVSPSSYMTGLSPAVGPVGITTAQNISLGSNASSMVGANSLPSGAITVPSFIPAGTTILLAASTTTLSSNNNVHTGNSITISTTLTKDWHPGDSTMHVKGVYQTPHGINTTQTMRTDHGYLQVDPGTSIVAILHPKIHGQVVVVTLGQEVGHSGPFKGQKATYGDTLNVQSAMTSGVYAGSAGSPGVWLTKPVTTTQQVTEKVYHDAQQQAIVDYSAGSPLALTGTIGTYVGGVFTAYTSSTPVTNETYDAIRFSTNPGSGVLGEPLSGRGIPNGAIVKAIDTVGGNYVVTFENPATNTILTGTTPLTGSATTPQVLPSFSVQFTTTADVTIPAGSMTIPVKSFIPKINFPVHTPVNIYYHTPSYFGSNALTITTTATASPATPTAVSLVPATSAKGWNAGNSVKVRGGVTYGLSAFSKVLWGSGSPQFSLYIDWYTEAAQYLGTSDGREFLTQQNPLPAVADVGSLGGEIIGSGSNITAQYAVTGVSLNDTANEYGSGWTPNAIVALAPAGATRAVPRAVWYSPVANDGYALSGVMFKALNIPDAGSGAITTTEIPTLVSAVSPDSIYDATTLVIDPNTPTESAASLYYFNPYDVSTINGNPAGARELIMGKNDRTRWVQVTQQTNAGDRATTLSSVDGLGIGSEFTVDYGTEYEEVKVVSAIDGNTVSITDTFTHSHSAGTNVYAEVVKMAHPATQIHTAGEPVAVFNWNRDGFINTPGTSFFYKVEKSENGGNTWSTVRNGASVHVDASGLATVVDYEVIPNIETLYRVTPYVTLGTGGDVHTIAGKTTTQLGTFLPSQTWWISSTSNESQRFAINVKDGYTETQKHPSGVFYPLGSSRPFTVSGVVQGRDGDITVIWTDNANWDNFLGLLEKGETLILTNPVESKRIYIFINQDVQITHHAAASPWREVEIQYVESAPPGFGYTYGS